MATPPPLLLATAKCCSSSSSPPRASSRRDAVYVAAVPLRATNGPAQMLMSATFSLGQWDLQHFMVVIKQHASSPQSQVVVFDFQPKDPENVYVALAALTCRQVPGVILKRNLFRLPKSRCWFVGFSNADGMDVAENFSEDWKTDLVLGKHDCRHYTNGELA